MSIIQVKSSDSNIGRPFVFFIRFIGVIFIAEFIVMLLLKYFGVEETTLEFLGDSILLSIISAPFLYLLVIRVFIKRLTAESAKVRAASENELRATAYAEKMALKAYADNIVQSVPTGLLSISSDLRVLSANPAFCRMFALQADPVGSPVSEVPLCDKSKDMILAALSEDLCKDEKVVKLRIGDEVRYFRVNVTPMIQETKVQANALIIATDITRRRDSERKIFTMAYHDNLTGLPNRRLFNNRLRQVIATMSRERLMVAILFLDVDRFKYINDSLGHDVGDEFLKEIALRLRKTIRPSDTVARFGGDEFVILLGGIRREENILNVVKRIFTAFESPVTLKEHELRLSASMGVSIYPNCGDTPEALLKTADTAMYQAKESGGNKCQFYESEMGLLGAQWIKMEHKLNRAIAFNEFKLFYQPQINLATGNLVGMETLLRWQAPDAGIISPTVFIPMAEETGLIIPIGEWVLRNACAQAKSWQDKGYRCSKVSVNISMLQFARENFVQLVMDVLKETGLNPQNLELELTESIIMKNAEEIIEKLSALKDLGIRLAIDDFGTGYSSLSYLKLMPIDVIKIDRGFVKDINTDTGDEAIVKAIIRMGHSLDIETIAEGVETGEQLQVLKGHHCANIQGYLISRPGPPEAVEEFLYNSWNLDKKTSRLKPCRV